MLLALTNLFSDKLIKSSYQIDHHFNGDLRRKSLEKFVNDSFKKHYQVNLNKYYPLLLNLSSKNSPDSINAVAGIRSGGEGKLFSEYYLSTRLEDNAADFLQQRVIRQQIVEVGNFAPATIHDAPALFIAMIGFLYSAGYSCVVFTAVPWVCNAFKRMGLPLHLISDANPKCLPLDIQQQWGNSYYQHNPKVYMGDLSVGFQAMQKKFLNSNHRYYSLWQDALSLGQNFNAIESAA
ncbi:MAG: thermostable hemolysin [Pseudomonadota bacterium]